MYNYETVLVTGVVWWLEVIRGVVRLVFSGLVRQGLVTIRSHCGLQGSFTFIHLS
jgi:hypothetical protein